MAPEHLSRSEHSALGIPSPAYVRIRPLVPGSPDQHRKMKRCRNLCRCLFLSEITEREEERINPGSHKFLHDCGCLLRPPADSVLADIIDINDIH